MLLGYWEDEDEGNGEDNDDDWGSEECEHDEEKMRNMRMKG